MDDLITRSEFAIRTEKIGQKYRHKKSQIRKALASF
jgi:hypothetical protein